MVARVVRAQLGETRLPCASFDTVLKRTSYYKVLDHAASVKSGDRAEWRLLASDQDAARRRREPGVAAFGAASANGDSAGPARTSPSGLNREP